MIRATANKIFCSGRCRASAAMVQASDESKSTAPGQLIFPGNGIGHQSRVVASVYAAKKIAVRSKRSQSANFPMILFAKDSDCMALNEKNLTKFPLELQRN